MNDKKRQFAILTALLIISRGMDLAMTAWYSPNLSMEANPVVALLNWQWKGLIFTTLTVLGGVLMCLYYEFFLIKPSTPASPDCPSATLPTCTGSAGGGP